MMNHILHNYPSLIRCLRVFHILVLAYLLSRCYCYNHYKIPKTLLLLSLLLLPLPPLSYYFANNTFIIASRAYFQQFSLIYFSVATATITTKYQKHYFCCLYFCYRYHRYHITLLLNTLLQILSFQVWLN